MNLRNFLLKTGIFLLTTVLFTGLSTKAMALEYPETEASSAILVDAETDRPLYSYNADEKVYPASTTKIMTALLVFEAIERDEIGYYDVVTVSETFAEGLTSDGSTADIQPGEELSVEELLHCVLMASANEACNVLAEYLCGSIDAFVTLMNERAEELGCTGTHFTNTHGLPDDNHYTTAWDLYLISREALLYESFVGITSTLSYTIPITNKSDIRELETTNLLLDPSSQYYYEYASGVKTGSTKAAGSCLVSTAAKDDIHIIAIVMGVGRVTDSSQTVTTKETSFSVTKYLYEWAFENYSYYEVLNANNEITSVPVSMASDADSVSAQPANSLSILLPNDYVDEDISIEISLTSEETGQELVAPVTVGQILGKITVKYEDDSYGPVNLVSSSNVELSRTEYLKSEIAKTFDNVWVKVAVITIVLLIILYIVFIINVKTKKKKHKKTRSGK